MAEGGITAWDKWYVALGAGGLIMAVAAIAYRNPAAIEFGSGLFLCGIAGFSIRRMTVRKWRVLGVIILVVGLTLAAHGLYRLVAAG
jgi:hypothetical protein